MGGGNGGAAKEETEPLAEAPDVPAGDPARASRPFVPLVCALLAVLILGVGILIGLGPRGKDGESEPDRQVVVGVLDLPPHDTLTGGWLEKTPAGLEDEVLWREAPLHRLAQSGLIRGSM